jgi:hypothetical protein
MIDIKQKQAVTRATPVTSAPVDLSQIPDVSLADVQACLKRSGAARDAHATLERHHANGTQLSAADLQGLLKRAGVQTTDVKTVLAYHCHHHRNCFSHDALRFMATLDWSDVAASAHIDELKRQNAEQVKGHTEFIAKDFKGFEAERADRKKLRAVTDDKAVLQQKSPLELEADFAEETTKSGLNPKEAFLLLNHRRRFAND